MGRSGPRQSDILVQAHKTTGESTPDSPYPSGTWQVKPFSILSGKKLSGNSSASSSGNIRSIWGTGNSTSRRRNTPGKVGKMKGNRSKATNYPGQYDQKFQKGVQRRHGVKMTPGRLRTLCEVEWPAYGSWLATRGHSGLEDDKAVSAIVTGKPGHPDQFPYIDSWLERTQDPPPWA